MKNMFTNLKYPAIISFFLMLPFLILELVNRPYTIHFPIPLFVLLWLLPTIFMLIMMPLVRTVRAGNSLMARPIPLVLSAVFLILIAWMWTGIVIDQMPCFLGVPNCD
jgi:hypothetical protein